MIMDDIFVINQKVASELCNLTNKSNSPYNHLSQLIFPEIGNKFRISEQESRFLYCALLNASSYYYSIETPTEKKYQMTGQTPISASSDLSLYSHNGNKFEKLANVEFKAHNPQKKDIKKDIEKLIREGKPGNWFHTLKNIDSQTLHSLFAKIRDSIKDFSNEANDKEISIIFCFCVIEKKWACIKHFFYDSSKGNFEQYVDDFFRLNYHVKSDKVQTIQDSDWHFYTC
jgi:hypothetical protein